MFLVWRSQHGCLVLFSHPFCVWTTYTESQLIKIQIIVWSLCFIFITVISDRLCFAIRLHVDQNQALQVQQPAHNGESANAVRLRKSSISTFCVYFVFYFIICSFFCSLLARQFFKLIPTSLCYIQLSAKH